MATYGLISTGEMVSDVHSVSALNNFDALIAMCLEYNHENHDIGFITDGTEIYEYQGFDPEDDDCAKDFPGFNPDVDPYLDPDKYDRREFLDKYSSLSTWMISSLSVRLCYTLNVNDVKYADENSELGCYESAEDAREAALNEFFLNDSEFTILDPYGDEAEQEQVAKPSLADVKKKVAEKKEAVDHTDGKTKSNGR